MQGFEASEAACSLTGYDSQHVSLNQRSGKEGLRNHNGTRWRIVRTEVLFVCLSQLVEVLTVGQVNPDHDDIACATTCRPERQVKVGEDSECLATEVRCEIPIRVHACLTG